MLKSGLLEAVQIGECIVVIITISLVIITLLLIELYIMEIYITFLSVDEMLWSMQGVDVTTQNKPSWLLFRMVLSVFGM